MVMQASTEHPNAQVIHGLIDAFLTGDFERFMDGFTEDAVFRVAGDNIISGEYRSKPVIRDYFIRLGQVTGGSMRIDVDEVLAGDQHAVMFIHVTTDRKGMHLEAECAEAFRLNDDGKITESWFLYEDQAAYDAFYAEE